MTLGKDDLIAALRLRYDHHSAQAVLEAARARAGLADQAAYDARDVATLRAALAKVGDRLDKVNERLDSLLGASPARPPDAMPAGKADAPQFGGNADAHPSGNAGADAKPATAEAIVDATPETGADAMPNTKAEAKPGSHPETKGAATVDTKPDAKPDAKVDTKPEALADAAPDGESVATVIALTGVDASEGEQILICGGFPTLGDWDPARARPLRREGNAWQTTVMLPRGAAIAFKFLRRRADGGVIWEGGDDRQLAPQPRFEATWRAPEA